MLTVAIGLSAGIGKVPAWASEDANTRPRARKTAFRFMGTSGGAARGGGFGAAQPNIPESRREVEIKAAAAAAFFADSRARCSGRVAQPFETAIEVLFQILDVLETDR